MFTLDNLPMMAIAFRFVPPTPSPKLYTVFF